MSGRHKSFDVKKMDPSVRNDRITFELADKEFKCRAVLPGWLLLKFVAMSATDKRGSDAGALFQFFRDVLEPASYDEFETLVSGDEYMIEMETLGEISSWLIGEYTNRPTQPQSPSVNGDGTTGTTSVENVDSVASTPTPLTPVPSST